MPILLLPFLALALPGIPAAQGERESLGQEPAGTDSLLHVVADEIELSELMDALARMRGVPIDFDRDRLSKHVTVRSRAGLSLDGLWAAANRLLFAEGLACVQAAGEEGLSVVSLESAAALARVERHDLLGAAAGYVRTLVELSSDDAAGKVASSVQKAFEKGGLRVEPLPDTGHLLIAGLLPSVEEALRLVRVLDRSPGAVVLEEIPVVHVSVMHLAALLEQLVQKEKAIAKDAFLGSVIARPSSGSLLVVASEEELPAWRERIARLDVEEALDTRWYVPRRFGLAETAKLVESLLGPPQGGEGPSITQDGLTGSLVITATPSQHAAVEAVFRRLDETDSPTRRVLRSFPVKYRDVEELLGMLSALVEAGAALPEVLGSPPANAEPDPAPPMQGATAEIATKPESVGPTVLREESGAALSLSADPGSSRILAFGEPRLLAEVENLLRTLDVPRPQVLVEALVVTLTESEVLQLGVELRKSGTVDGALYELGSVFGLGVPSTAAGGIATPTGAGFSGVVLDPGSFSVLLRALETQEKGRTLTLPKVLVENHGQAMLDSVVESPYLSTNASTTVATTSFGGSTEAGTQISITPHIGEGDRLRLEYSVSVSAFVGAPADPALPPPRQENKREAAASLPDGYAVIVGGLEVEGRSERVSRVPWLGELPLIGWLFRASTDGSTKSRLYVFMRASILRSQTFEDLRWASERPLHAAGVESGWPTMKPRIIR